MTYIWHVSRSDLPSVLPSDLLTVQIVAREVLVNLHELRATLRDQAADKVELLRVDLVHRYVHAEPCRVPHRGHLAAHQRLRRLPG